MQARLHNGTGHICTVTGVIVTEVIIIQNQVLDSLLFLALSFLLGLHRYCKARVRR